MPAKKANRTAREEKQVLGWIFNPAAIENAET
jgi:hypothetical protein